MGHLFTTIILINNIQSHTTYIVYFSYINLHTDNININNVNNNKSTDNNYDTDYNDDINNNVDTNNNNINNNNDIIIILLLLPILLLLISIMLLLTLLIFVNVNVVWIMFKNFHHANINSFNITYKNISYY